MKTLFKLSLGILLTLTLAETKSFAQTQGAGNGGDPNELAEFTGKNGEHLDSWAAVRQDFIRWLELDRFLELDLGSIDSQQFKLTMLQTFRSTKIEWDDKPITVDGASRPCENYIDTLNVKRIHCNQTNYAAAMKNYDAETQYKMIGHEYFSLGNFEPNSYGVSDYTISDQISKKLKLVKVKKLAVNQSSFCDIFIAGNLNNSRLELAEKIVKEKKYRIIYSGYSDYVLTIKAVADHYQEGDGVVVEALLEETATKTILHKKKESAFGFFVLKNWNRRVNRVLENLPVCGN